MSLINKAESLRLDDHDMFMPRCHRRRRRRRRCYRHLRRRYYLGCLRWPKISCELIPLLLTIIFCPPFSVNISFVSDSIKRKIGRYI